MIVDTHPHAGVPAAVCHTLVSARTCSTVLVKVSILEHGVHAIGGVVTDLIIHPSGEHDHCDVVALVSQREQQLLAIDGSRHAQIQDD